MEELSGHISDAYNIQEKSIDKIALDYTYSLGQLDGMRESMQILKDIEEILNDRE